MGRQGLQRLQGKVAIVTGSGRGLGRAIAEKFGQEGALVVSCDLDGGLAGETARAIRNNGGSASAAAADVNHGAQVDALIESAISAHGRIDIVCNNAGILDGFAPLLDTDEALWDRVIGVNLKGAYRVSRAALPHMLRQGSGTFVNIASMAGLVAQAGGLAYTVSKHGMIGLTRQISADYGQQGIRANAICPGSMDTEMSRDFLKDSPEVQAIVNSVPAGRMGRPEEVAELAAYLASDTSAFIHGAAIVIDGGWTIR